MMKPWDFVIPGICGMGIHLQVDGFRLIYLCIAVLMWGMSGMFSREYMAHYPNKKRYYRFFWMTFVATCGVFLSADLYTTFIFFEIMSFTSYVWVAFDEKKESLKAAETYLAVAVIGGMVMLMGLFLLYDLLGTLEISQLAEAAAPYREEPELYVAGALMLVGFGAKAGCFPLHIWLPKAHPVAPAPASALLSGILTKTGVFGIIVVSCQIFGGDKAWGLVMTGLGFVTMFLGAVLALVSVNLKRTLACSSVSQIGFILTGIGMSCLLSSAGESNALAVRGAFLHMVNHSLLKLVLFLCAGVVFMNLHQLELNDIRGFGRKKPALCFGFFMGSLGIGGMPLWNGYVSKTLLHESIVEYGHIAADSHGLWTAAEWLFLLTGGITVAYMLKLFVALFVEKHPTRQGEFDGLDASYMRPLSRLSLVAPALLLPVLGMTPQITMDGLADLGQAFFAGDPLEHGIHYFSVINLKGSLISIGIGLFLYLAVVRTLLMEKNRETAGEKSYVNRWPNWLDLENLVYRPLLQVALPGIGGAICQVLDRYVLSVLVQVFLSVSSVVCRGMDHLADGLILFARRTTHRQVRKKKAYTGTGRMAHVRNLWMDDVADIRHTGKLVEESFSFGLMLFCIGLCLTLGYLLFVFFQG